MTVYAGAEADAVHSSRDHLFEGQGSLVIGCLGRCMEDIETGSRSQLPLLRLKFPALAKFLSTIFEKFLIYQYIALFTS
jgi:hypothetical protein